MASPSRINFRRLVPRNQSGVDLTDAMFNIDRGTRQARSGRVLGDRLGGEERFYNLREMDVLRKGLDSNSRECGLAAWFSGCALPHKPSKGARTA